MIKIDLDLYARDIINLLNIDCLNDIKLIISNEVKICMAEYVYNYKTKRKDYTVMVGVDCLNSKDYQYTSDVNGINEYIKLDMFKYIDTELLKWTFVLLHELGHIIHWNNFGNKIKDVYRMTDLHETEINMTMSALNYPKTKKSIAKMYTMTSNEANANAFAYRYLPLVVERLLKNK